MDDDYKDIQSNDAEKNKVLDSTNINNTENISLYIHNILKGISEQDLNLIIDAINNLSLIDEENFKDQTILHDIIQDFGLIVGFLENLLSDNIEINEIEIYNFTRIINVMLSYSNIDIIEILSSEFIEILFGYLQTKKFITAIPNVLGIVRILLNDKNAFEVANHTFSLDFICDYSQFITEANLEIRDESFENIICCIYSYATKSISSDQSYQIIKTFADNAELIDINVVSQRYMCIICTKLIDSQLFDFGIGNKYGIIKMTYDLIYSDSLEVESAAAVFLQRVASEKQLLDSCIPDISNLLDHIQTITDSTLFSQFALFTQQLMMMFPELGMKYIPNLMNIYENVHSSGKTDIILIVSAIFDSISPENYEFFFNQEIISNFVECLLLNGNSPISSTFVRILLTLRGCGITNQRDEEWMSFIEDKIDDLEDLCNLDTTSDDMIQKIELIYEQFDEES
ncbi:hypothetical protein TVAG_300260 [Trichomonas vaginalis G3]|uniref:Uncharacterized protein n=1 Tax=Trichomonas vaginalis (strain ATCC PRA-98 / G3) TaxID=412133 RepID=A2FYK4_TRIV3|nr:armadillo (ARM) repeat-containing protein family [Trichomonas vaginalis G3]EAX90008.1 hypothetical protein TVAG_300260 [Trichomonas vaginalis G3]KAI5532074.1 armadillo (ARM) repeat-containing protein family [Trichomonas vaginalis G3]|eukprot:XP_001302938.1 hypothetical protein [Trichomonas vaginalis G3]